MITGLTGRIRRGVAGIAIAGVAVLGACSPAAEAPAADAPPEAVAAPETAAPEPEPLPAEVLAFMAERTRECTTDLGGQMETPDGFITRADFNADGRTDYAIDGGKYACAGAYSMYCGSAGCEANMFVSKPDGSYAADSVNTDDELSVTADPTGDILEIGVPWIYRDGKWGPKG